MSTQPVAVSDAAHWVDVYLARTDATPDAVYAVADDTTLTYGELRHRVDALASALLHRGVRPGDVVAVWMTNSIEFLIAQWATYRAGCALLPLYSYYREVELRHALAESGASVLVTCSEFGGKVDVPATLAGLLPELRSGSPEFAGFPSLHTVVSVDDLGLPGVVGWAELTAKAEVARLGLERIRGRLAPTDLMNVMYTSGTTGTPKAGLSMHVNNLATIRHWCELARLGPRDVVLTQVPMFTNFGCLYTNGLAMYAGCRMEVTRTFDAGRSLALIAERGVTYLPGSPEMLRMILDHPDFGATDTSSVATAHVAGSYLDEQLMSRIIDELAPNAMQAYGMSECGGLSTVTSDRDPIEARLHTVGRPLPSALVRVTDPVTGEEQPVGTVGEIWFGDAWPGSCVGKGYLASPEATAAAITPDGWFRSGDLGRYDDAGYLHFVGRLKNMFTVGGFNIYPAEVENHVLACPGVATCHAVGVPDDRLGQVPAAFVVAEPGAGLTPADVIDFMRERVSSQKRPRHVWIVAPEDLPTTPSGKVRTGALADLATRMIANPPH